MSRRPPSVGSRNRTNNQYISSNANNNPVNIIICDGSNQFQITMSELGLNQNSSLLDLYKKIKDTPTITDHINTSCFNFHKIVGLQVNNAVSRCLNIEKYRYIVKIDNMYLSLFDNCVNDLDVNTIQFVIHKWVGNLLILLIQKKNFDLAQQVFNIYIVNPENPGYFYTKIESLLGEQLSLFYLATNGNSDKIDNNEDDYEKNNKGLLYPNGIQDKTYMLVLEYINEEKNETHIFPLSIYRIQDLKKIQEIIFNEQYQNVMNYYNRTGIMKKNTKTDFYVYQQEKTPGLVLQISLEIDRGINGGKTITKKKKVKFLKKRKTNVLKKRKTKKRIMK